MSGASLFPDDYPVPPPKEPRPSCCADVVAPTGVMPTTWLFLHTLAHSRVPFTCARLMAVTKSPETEARVAIGEAGQRGWLAVVWPEHYMVDPVEQWVGALPKRR